MIAAFVSALLAAGAIVPPVSKCPPVFSIPRGEVPTQISPLPKPVLKPEG